MTTTPQRKPTPTPRPTISSIAVEAGVSIPTVSKVLNGRPGVAPHTRARIEQVIEQHQFRRRHRGPSPGPRLIDLAFHRLESAWSLEIIKGVESAATAAGVGVVISEFEGKHRPQQDWLDAVLARRPLGVILVLSSLDLGQRHQLDSRSIPYVIVDTAGDLPPAVPAVGSNNWNGGLLATRHLIELGHKRIAIVSGPEAMLCSHARIDGFRSAHAEARLEIDPSLVHYGTFEVEAGYRHGHQLLSRMDRPTAIFAGSDLQALGVLRAARELRLEVPGDVSVVGYDNLPFTEWTGPALTTIDQHLDDMARTATRMLLKLGSGKTPPLLRADIATELVSRESTAPPL